VTVRGVTLEFSITCSNPAELGKQLRLNHVGGVSILSGSGSYIIDWIFLRTGIALLDLLLRRLLVFILASLSIQLWTVCSTHPVDLWRSTPITVGLAFHERRLIKVYEIHGSSSLDPDARLTDKVLSVKHLMAPIPRCEFCPADRHNEY
jgi:hypothetical protein